MKTLTRKLSRTAITLVLVILAFIAIFRAWVYYTESPWTRDARFSADVVAIAPDVAGLITHVNVHDNQLVQKDQVLFTIDQPRYQKALAEAEADVAYYQVLAQEKRQEAGRRNRLGVQAMSREEIDQANNVLQTVLHQLAKAQATRDLAKLDLERTVIRAPADGWVTNLNVYAGEFITRGFYGRRPGEKELFLRAGLYGRDQAGRRASGISCRNHAARQQPGIKRYRR